ncbi:TPA: type II toxin-antitoxin system Phd/YefM family antitoxin [Salmonella enterica subsp. enterica serovar Warragul]
MKVKTVSYLKKNATKLDLAEPILVMRNGIPVCAIESYDAWQERVNSIVLLKLLTLSEQDKTEGKVFSKKQLLAGLL